MRLMHARGAQGFKSNVLNRKTSKQCMLGTRENLDLNSFFANKKARMTDTATQDAVVQALSPETPPMCTQGHKKRRGKPREAPFEGFAFGDSLRS